jgi:RNA polymerase sigma factor (sigma-70 family)
METDSDLLSQYVRNRSEAAFAELVRRHVNLVYSAACREMRGEASAAQDITQMVFLELAQKAGPLTRHPSLAGWLYISVRHFSANLRRGENRRVAREEQVSIMNDSFPGESPELPWATLEPVLDDALHELRENDRHALVLRFFEENSLREVGMALGLSENAARMRVERALEKLRLCLAKRGVLSSSSVLSAALGAGAMISVPPDVSANVILGAISIAASGVAVATTWTATLNLVSMTKLKVAVIAGLATESFIHFS